jgi:hypothetical protein
VFASDADARSRVDRRCAGATAVNDLLVLGMVWVPWGLVIGRDTYDDLRSSVSLRWYPGHAGARAVVVAVSRGSAGP